MKDSADTLIILKKLAEAIVSMFGRNCEVAVHDLSRPGNTLIYIAGNVTSRNMNAPADDLLKKTLCDEPEAHQDLHNYTTISQDGRPLKTTTLFLRDNDGKLFAAFCIYLDTTDFFNAAQTLAPFTGTGKTGENQAVDPLALPAVETIESLFSHNLVEIGRQPATMTTQEKIRLVSLLEEQGVFQMKGSVNRIAELCGVSKYTIYNYLKTIRTKRYTTTNGDTDEKTRAN